VSGARIHVEGRGSREPIATNDTNDGRARNRRVEIYVGERTQG
jgi:flagellar motor protein MotB